ncbi:MAG: hypothetical protein ACJ72Z_10915 [Pyrinomonadaceae bacterium]
MNTNERFDKANAQAVGKVITKLVREFQNEVSVEFSDGTRLHIDGENPWMEMLMINPLVPVVVP